MKVILKNVRLAFPEVFEAVQYQGQGPFNYRATFLIPKDSAQYKEIQAAIEKVAHEKWLDKAPNILKSIAGTNKVFVADGDIKDYNGYAGNWAITTVRSVEDGPPRVGYGKGRPIKAADGKIYSGCYVNGSFDVWPQDNAFGKGIRATLISVQFVKDGPSFGGAAPATEDDFEELPFEDDDDDDTI